MGILRLYDVAAFDAAEEQRVLQRLQAYDKDLVSVRMERCYHLEYINDNNKLTLELERLMRWLIRQPLQMRDTLSEQVTLKLKDEKTQLLLEIGPRFNFSTAYSTNCVNIFQNLGHTDARRMETSTCYLLTFARPATREAAGYVELLGDRMTQCLYTTENKPGETFDEQLPTEQAPWHYVPVLEQGRAALEQINRELGLAFTDFDLDYYNELFGQTLKRDPTTVELFDCAQSNSEHSRHWFFRGRMMHEGKELPSSLIKLIMDTQSNTNPNNTIKFSDNSSAIVGFEHETLQPKEIGVPSVVELQRVQSDLIFTAETHNMPTAVAPFSGATTGTGGRLRDVQGVGRGGLPIAGTAGYCVGALHIPGYPQPYEPTGLKYPGSFAPPLQVLIEASNGASDYGNKFGEPLISGFTVSYGLYNAADPKTRQEYVKPIMFSGGLGTMPASMRHKIMPERGQLLAKIGGPVYRIGVGGGAASSVEVQGSGDAELDFNAVQRGDPEMENKLNRVVRACLELGDRNPILAIHDQGAGGNGNVLKELVEPGFAGAIIFSKEFKLGDPTITALELWGTEYQENDAILCKPEDRELLEKICARERCPISFVGVVTGDGRVTLVEQAAPKDMQLALQPEARKSYGPPPFDLELSYVLGDMPKRVYHLTSEPIPRQPLQLAKDLQLADALERVLSIVAVGSKRFLTNKVDRCVGGLIVQQQCVGPLQAPLSDYALTTVSHFSSAGIATSIGTQPIMGIVNTEHMANMCVAEALSNLVFVKISEMADIKCSGNWMWAAKLPGEGYKMYQACLALSKVLKELRIGIDGGKDSLSMAANVNGDVVKSPGTLVISTYAPCPDVNVRITADLKGPARGKASALLWINIEGCARLGGSALAQAYSQQGDSTPNMQQTQVLAKAFEVTQSLLAEGCLLAGHDVSDGGLIVCLLEMAIGGLGGLLLDIKEAVEGINNYDAVSADIGSDLCLLFSEESGWVLEVAQEQLEQVRSRFTAAGVPNYCLGNTQGHGLDSAMVVIKNGAKSLLSEPLRKLYKQWERTSYELEKLQANVECAQSEYDSLDYRQAPQYKAPLQSLQSELILKRCAQPVRVAVLREEGVNSEREMMASLLRANFEVHDVTMSDLLAGTASLSQYRGLVFPGGFSYADTLGSARGWAANILHSPVLRPQFEAFKQRPDVFSLGICNGCQLMTLIGFVGSADAKETRAPATPEVALLHNRSQRFECRWSTVRIPPNRALMLRNMHEMVLGCWVAHGEGRFAFQREAVQQQLQKEQLVTLQYVDDVGAPTELYPMNPNGSPKGIAGLCSPDGRHLALMPHPERCSAMYQWPYVPPDFDVPATQLESPWQLMFHNAYKWCTLEE